MNLPSKFDCSLLGLGYIGLPTAAVIACLTKMKVLGVDINEEVIEITNNGKPHFLELKLENFLHNAISKNKLIARNKPYYSDTFMITVPTPIKRGKAPIPKPDLSYVFAAAESIVPYLKKGNLIILESTCPVGTSRKLLSFFQEKTGFDEKDIFIAYCPERVLPGNIIYELEHNDRVVGGINDYATQKAFDFYSQFCKGKIWKTNAETAEMVKLSENSYRDVNLAFANELSMICDQKNINIRELIKLSNKHPRVNILQPGCGVGGHCIAVDPWFIVSSSESSSPLIKAARQVNENKVLWSINKIKSFAKKFKTDYKRNPILGFFGITFKPDVEDLRNSPALEIVESILNDGFEVLVCEPNIDSYKNLNLSNSNYVIEKSDLIILLVSHSNFKTINLKNRSYLDLCGITQDI